MQRTFRMLLLLCALLAGLAVGCTSAASDSDQPEAEQAAPAEEPVIDAGISVSGTVVEAAGKRIDLAEKNEYVRNIVRCRWLEQNKVAIEGTLDGVNSQALYLAVYDVVRGLYVYEQYGKQFIWQNDDLDTLVYVVDYAKDKEPSRVLNKKDVLLYETSGTEQIQNISYVPKGLKVEVTDLHGDSLRQVVVEVSS